MNCVYNIMNKKITSAVISFRGSDFLMMKRLLIYKENIWQLEL